MNKNNNQEKNLKNYNEDEKTYIISICNFEILKLNYNKG